MRVIQLKNQKDSLNKVESFVEEICDEFNLGNTFLGNMLIAITEVVNIIECQNSDVQISFTNDLKKFLFTFSEFSKKLNPDYFKGTQIDKLHINTEMEDSLLMINALCDDLYFDEKKNKLILTFLNPGIEDEVSKHRKEYLSNFLNQRIQV